MGPLRVMMAEPAVPMGATVGAKFGMTHDVAMVPTRVMSRPSLGRGLHTQKGNSGDQSRNDFQFHYDVFPSRYERCGNLFRFVFTM